MVGWLKHIISEFFYNYPSIPHFTTLQKFADRINNVMLGKIISSFVVLTGTRRHIFVGIIDSTGFKITRASQDYYTERAKLRRRKYAKSINRR